MSGPTLDREANVHATAASQHDVLLLPRSDEALEHAQRLPKVELHAHLDCGLSYEVVHRLDRASRSLRIAANSSRRANVPIYATICAIHRAKWP